MKIGSLFASPFHLDDFHPCLPIFECEKPFKDCISLGLSRTVLKTTNYFVNDMRF